MGRHKKDKHKEKKHRHRSGQTAECAEKKAGKLERERARAHFLDGSTGPWAKALAAQDARESPAAEEADPDSAGTAHTRRGPDYSMPSSIDIVADPVLYAMSTRRSISKVDPETPSDSDLLELIRAVSSVADHKGLRPWRFLILRGDDRHRLGAALDEAAGVVREPGEVNRKPLRAELLLALVCSPTEHEKVPEWEQRATAAGAGHLLELALWQAGWGVMWRSGTLANTPPVRRLHRLEDSELLMGWFYIGAVPERYRQRLASSTRPLPRPEQFLDTL
ncbi:nitroreductase family protein [Brevibacterium renqingii]|uniref:nitroreductase family protein n=1 Tax=Brevibacterium renqingii TaxID=2776916 RepID=UPI001AE0DBEE|nr:nitroreductase family protein [Brevibacterium renqingii]